MLTGFPVRGAVGHAKNLAPTGMPNGHPAHVWVVVLGPLAWDASRAVQRCHAGVRLCVYRPSPRRARPGRQPPKPVQNRLSVIQQKNLFQFSCGCFSSVVYCSLPIKKKAALAVKKGGLPFRDKHSAVEPGWWVHTPRIAQCTRREKLIWTDP